MATTTAKAKTWRSFQFLDNDALAKVSGLLSKNPFGAEVGYKLDGTYVQTNAPIRDLGFALKRELGLTLPDAEVLDGDPRNGVVAVSADKPVETAAEADTEAAKAEKARQAQEAKEAREKATADRKAAAEVARAAKATEREEAKAAKAKAREEAKAAKAANSPKSKKAIREEAGTAEATPLERHGRMYASTIEVRCGKCQAIKEVHVRSWAGIGYTYCNSCHAKLPYVKSADSGPTEQDRKARGFRRTLDGIGRLLEATSLLTDEERASAQALHDLIRYHVDAPAWVVGGGDAQSADDAGDNDEATDEPADEEAEASNTSSDVEV